MAYIEIRVYNWYVFLKPLTEVLDTRGMSGPPSKAVRYIQ